MIGDLNYVLYQDPSLRLRQTSGTKYRISIEFALSGFSFCIKSQNGQKVLAIGCNKIKYKGSYLRVLQQMIQTFECDNTLCDLEFETAELLFSDTAFTIVPLELFEPDKQAHYLNFSANKEINSIRHQTINGMDAVCVFEYYEQALVYWNSRCDKVQARHSIAAFTQNAATTPEYALHVQMREDDFSDMVVIKNGKIELINSFCMTNGLDLSYFMLLVCNQLGVDNTKTKVMLYGSSQIAMEQKNNLDKFFPMRKFAGRNSEIEFSNALDFITPWEHHTIVNSL